MSSDTFIPPAQPVDLDRDRLAAKLSEASRSLGAYSGLLEALPNPWVLLAPLGRREAMMSSQIEGTQATVQEVLVFEAEGPSGIRPERRGEVGEVANYWAAMEAARVEIDERDKPIRINLIKQLHEILLDSVRGRLKGRGQFRREAVFINTVSGGRYVPPPWEEVEGLMHDLEVYMHDEDWDPLVQVALVHGQFELIHPFLDGNGRVGRMLIPLLLAEKKTLTGPFFYVSEYLEKNRAAYYGALERLSTKGDWTGWVEFFLEGVRDQSEVNAGRARQILHLYGVTRDRVVELTNSKYAATVVDGLFQSAVFTSPSLGEMTGIGQAQLRYILQKLDGEVVEVLRAGKTRRPTVWVFSDLLDIVL